MTDPNTIRDPEEPAGEYLPRTHDNLALTIRRQNGWQEQPPCFMKRSNSAPPFRYPHAV